MRERLDKIFEELRELNEKIGKKNRRIILLVTVLAIAGIAAVMHFSSIVTYEVLYTGLSSDDQVEILGAIQELGVDSKSDDNGTIQVPSGQADSVRAQLAMQGYPKSGLSYDVFTSNISMTSTDFEKETYKLYELQDRLAATIKYFSGVKDATVTIAVAEKSSYVLSSSSSDSDAKTTAAVTVIMQSGGSPTADQVTGIKKLVSSSVPGMSSEDVTVIDGDGNEVSGSGDSSEIGDSSTLSELKVELEQMAEASIKAKVLNLLEPIYGEDHVRVSVNCTVDIDQKVSELLTYYPSEDGDNSGVKEKETLNWESIGNGTDASGVVGTESNSEVPTYPYTSDNEEGEYYTDNRTYEYLVSQLTEQVKKDAGEVTDTNVSIVIDSGSLTNTEIEELKDLVAVTAGIDTDQRDDRVAIMDTKFATITPADEVAQTLLQELLSLGPILYIIIGAILLLIILLIVVKRMLKARKKRRAAQAMYLEPEDEEEIEWDSDSINLGDIEETKEQVLKGQIRDFASQNPEIAASLIKNWLKEDGEG
jgi:flagellar M-ring protein FliF